jgi:3-oxoadipate enol-lactonase
MNFSICNNILLHWSDQGPRDGLTIVFSNSIGTDFRIWDMVAAELSRRFRIIHYDQRGHGLSETPSPPYSLSDHVADLAGLLDNLAIREAIVVGLSVGGMIAQQFAAAHRERVCGLVLCDTAACIGPPEFWTKRIEAIRASGVKAVSDAILPRWFAPDFKQRQPELYAGLRNMLIRIDPEGYIGTCAAIRDADLTEIAKSIGVPTLCLCGAQDSATPPDQVRALAELIPHAEFDLIDNAGHLPCIEQPAVVAHRINQFIEENNLV